MQDPQDTPIEEVEDNDPDLERSDLVVCIEATEEAIARIPEAWRDQTAFDQCCGCGTKIMFRTNSPQNVRKACVDCAMTVIEAAGTIPRMITRKSAANEAREFLRK